MVVNITLHVIQQQQPQAMHFNWGIIVGGVCVQQNFSQIPDVRAAWLDLKSRWKR